jgi:hypothetical protein
MVVCYVHGTTADGPGGHHSGECKHLANIVQLLKDGQPVTLPPRIKAMFPSAGST